jgi:quercetin dioxygenase-like cupin family protein
VQIIRPRPDSRPGPADWFTGSVWLDELISLPAPSHLRLLSVHFSPGARTAWHRHPVGQAIHVTEGVGRCQRRGGPVEEIRGGDTVWFEPGEWHWHGAGPATFMTHTAVQVTAEDGTQADWADHVTDAEYGA